MLSLSLHRVFSDLNRCLWQVADHDTPRLARVIMTFKHTRPLTSSPSPAPVPPPANDFD